MPRIAGVDLPNEKRVGVALTYIYGIGPVTAQKILQKTGISADVRAKNLSEADTGKLRQVIENDYKVEGALRGEVAMAVKRLMDIGSYRGIRHRKGLPVRGQRTRTNSRTRKGPKRRTQAKKPTASTGKS